MKKAILLFILTFGIASIQAQTNKTPEKTINTLKLSEKTDTLQILELLKQAASSYGVNPLKMEQTAQDAISLSRQIGFKKGEAEGNKLRGAKYFSTGDFPNAEKYFTAALQIFDDAKIISGVIICNSNLGSVALVQNKYPEALKYYQNSIRAAEKAKLPKMAGMAYGNMGIIYSEQKKYDLALKHFNEALRTHSEAKFTEGIASSYGNIGNVYFNSKGYDQALDYFKKALDLNIELKNKLGMAREYGNIASVYSEQAHLEDAFFNYDNALKLNKEIGNKKGIAISTKGIGEYYFKNNDLDKALINNKMALKIATEIGTKDIQKEIFKNLSEIFEKQGIADSAYIYFKKYFETKEDIDNENNRKQISRLEVQYEFDTKEEKYKTQQLLDTENLKQQRLQLDLNTVKLNLSNKERDLVKLNYLKTQSDLKAEQLAGLTKKEELLVAENEILLKKNEADIAKLSLATIEKQKWMMILGLIFLSIIGALFYYQSLVRKKTNRKLQILNIELDEANKAKARFMAILNHDLRSPVANLLQFLHLQKDNPELLDESNRKRLEDKTTSAVENLLVSMEDILMWSKGQMQNFKPQLKKTSVGSLFDDIKKHFESYENVQFKFINPQNLTPNTDADYLKTIMRNLTGNAIKAIEKQSNPKIIWKAWEEKEVKYLSITDNGSGVSPQQLQSLFDANNLSTKSGLGLLLVRDLAKAISCEIKVNPRQEQGTTFVLKFL